MKKQMLLALSAGLAITASGLTFANTQSNSFQNGNSARNTVGSSDQGTVIQGDPSADNNGQTNSSSNTGSRNFKQKIADNACANGKCSKTSSTDSSSTTKNKSSDETTTQSS